MIKSLLTRGILLSSLFLAAQAYCGDKVSSYQLSMTVGDVKVSLNNGSSWNSAAPEMELKEAAIIKTGNNSYCDINMPNRGTFRIVDNSMVSISKLRKQLEEIKVKKGKALFSINKKLKADENFRVETDVAVAAVRGTQFVIEADDQKMKCSVGKGRVAIKRNLNVAAEDIPEDLKSSLEVDATANQELELTMDENKALENLLQNAKSNMQEYKSILKSAQKDMKKKVRLMKNASRLIKELNMLDEEKPVIEQKTENDNDMDESSGDDETEDTLNKIKTRNK